MFCSFFSFFSFWIYSFEGYTPLFIRLSFVWTMGKPFSFLITWGAGGRAWGKRLLACVFPHGISPSRSVLSIHYGRWNALRLIPLFIANIRRVKNFSAFFPDKYRYIVGSPFPARSVPHSLRKIKGLNGRIYIKTFSNTRGKTFSINLHHAVATPWFSSAT